MKLHEEPTLGEYIAAVISVITVGLIGYLAVTGNAAAQTSLVALAGAVGGTYFQTRQNGNAEKKPSTSRSAAP
jgi:hypothetical protein